jgi:hypothetical protein
VGLFSVDLLSLVFGEEAAFQNCAEHITLVVGLVLAKRAGLPMSAIFCRGDSVTALSWAEEHHFRGVRVSRAAAVYVVATQLYGIDRLVTIRLPKEVNTRADDLSRGATSEEVRCKYPELRGVPVKKSLKRVNHCRM